MLVSKDKTPKIYRRPQPTHLWEVA